MQSLECDVLIIGGGATGAGVLFDLALRGLRVILAEQNDIGTGTSGRYHGLLHSGARYVVRDPGSAKECIEENRILRRIAPHAIEDTGGLFVAIPPDDPDYVAPWLKGCAAAGIPAEEVPVAQALKEVPALNPATRVAYRVPDGSCDSWDLLHSLCEGAAGHGAQTLTYHAVRQIEVNSGKVTGALLEDRRSGEQVRVHAAVIVNAAGPWASEIGKLAGALIKMNLSKGIMVAMNTRWTNTVLNRLDMPGDGDILVPVGTVCVIGTTSVTVQRPDDNTIAPQEVSQMLDEGERLIPGFRKARALRAWAGVRPLYDGEADERADLKHDEHHTIKTDEGRFITRSFTLIDHASEGVGGLLSIVGGKLTTYRQMAERVADQVCKQLGIDKPCTTASTVLPAPGWVHEKRYHRLTSRLSDLEHASTQTGLICECELVTRPQLEQAIVNGGPSVSLDDLRRDLRLGMGPCQGGFCAYRAAGILAETCNLPAETAVGALRDFVQERFQGNRPLLWGHQLRQALLDESIYRRSLGLVPQEGKKRALSR
jgi:glycerol-3-phosphate dehydrogenase